MHCASLSTLTALESLQCADVGSVADVSEVRAASTGTVPGQGTIPPWICWTEASTHSIHFDPDDKGMVKLLYFTN
jgi:hypothetical protein